MLDQLSCLYCDWGREDAIMLSSQLLGEVWVQLRSHCDHAGLTQKKMMRIFWARNSSVFLDTGRSQKVSVF